MNPLVDRAGHGTNRPYLADIIPYKVNQYSINKGNFIAKTFYYGTCEGQFVKTEGKIRLFYSKYQPPKYDELSPCVGAYKELLIDGDGISYLNPGESTTGIMKSLDLYMQPKRVRIEKIKY